MQVGLIISAVVAFLIALYELSWIGKSSLALVLLPLALIVGFLAIAIYKTNADLEKLTK